MQAGTRALRVDISDDAYTRLRVVAATEDRSMTSVVRDLIHQHVAGIAVKVTEVEGRDAGIERPATGRQSVLSGSRV
jgi:hypothetical protein